MPHLNLFETLNKTEQLSDIIDNHNNESSKVLQKSYPYEYKSFYKNFNNRSDSSNLIIKLIDDFSTKRNNNYKLIFLLKSMQQMLITTINLLKYLFFHLLFFSKKHSKNLIQRKNHLQHVKDINNDFTESITI